MRNKLRGTKKHVPSVWQFYDHELEQFAKSIINECLAVADDIADDMERMECSIGAMYVAIAIERRFGLKNENLELK